MKRGKILVFVSSLFLVVALLTGCKKDKGPKLFGIDSIDNVLYGSQVYYAMGFSFELGDITSTLELPPPDITIHVHKDIDGNIAGKYFNTPQLVESFAFAGEYAGASEAKTAFDQLLEVGTRNWQLSAMDVEENQVWLFLTSEGNNVKFRIMEIITDNSQNPPYIQVKFEWRIQPDGSTSFSE
jgi:hypothetical protein